MSDGGLRRGTIGRSSRKGIAKGSHGKNRMLAGQSHTAISQQSPVYGMPNVTGIVAFRRPSAEPRAGAGGALAGKGMRSVEARNDMSRSAISLYDRAKYTPVACVCQYNFAMLND